MNRALIWKREADQRGEERSLLKNNNKKFQHVMVKKKFSLHYYAGASEFGTDVSFYVLFWTQKYSQRVRFLLYQEGERGLSKYLTTLKSLGHHIHVQTAEKNKYFSVKKNNINVRLNQ